MRIRIECGNDLVRRWYEGNSCISPEKLQNTETPDGQHLAAQHSNAMDIAERFRHNGLFEMLPDNVRAALDEDLPVLDQTGCSGPMMARPRALFAYLYELDVWLQNAQYNIEETVGGRCRRSAIWGTALAVVLVGSAAGAVLAYGVGMAATTIWGAITASISTTLSADLAYETSLELGNLAVSETKECLQYWSRDDVDYAADENPANYYSTAVTRLAVCAARPGGITTGVRTEATDTSPTALRRRLEDQGWSCSGKNCAIEFGSGTLEATLDCAANELSMAALPTAAGDQLRMSASAEQLLQELENAGLRLAGPECIDTSDDGHRPNLRPDYPYPYGA